ncbi:MAG: glutamate 5-kinase [Deltaproteobacteria bacterium]|jgi:glutamate 5-kinase
MSTRGDLKKLVRTGRVVVKIGSGVLTDGEGRLDPKTIRRLANEIAPIVGLRRWPYVVSSGAIAVGMGILGLKQRPRTMAGLQAAAAIGQSKLVEAWSSAFRKHDVPVAQVLLTHADLANRKRFLNARRALGELERRRAIAIVNENDTVSFEEIAVGDNDELAAHVSNLVDARLLVMLSVAPGVVNPSGLRIPEAHAGDDLLDTLATGRSSRFGTGGMISKIRAARVACARGAYVAILEGKAPGQLEALLDGEDVGTLIVPDQDKTKLKSRAHWIAHALRPVGTIVVDAGAEKALGEKRSLLSTGITSVVGDFAEGDPIEVARDHGPKPRTFARGLSRYSADQLRQIMGLPSGEISQVLGFTTGDAVVHKDDLVLL